MATKKTVLNEKTTQGYDVLHPETDINYVLDIPSGKTAKELIDESQVYSKHETFISTEDQTVFILQNGTYVTNDNRLEVIVGGVHQYSPDNFVETDSDRITFNDPLPLGLEVIINYFSGSAAITVSVENEINVISNQLNNHVDENSVDAHKATNITIDPIEGITASNVQEAVSAAFQAGNSRKEELVDELLQLDNSLQISVDDSWSTILNSVSDISKINGSSIKRKQFISRSFSSSGEISKDITISSVNVDNTIAIFHSKGESGSISNDFATVEFVNPATLRVKLKSRGSEPYYESPFTIEVIEFQNIKSIQTILIDSTSIDSTLSGNQDVSVTVSEYNYNKTLFFTNFNIGYSENNQYYYVPITVQPVSNMAIKINSYFLSGVEKTIQVFMVEFE